LGHDVTPCTETEVGDLNVKTRFESQICKAVLKIQYVHYTLNKSIPITILNGSR